MPIRISILCTTFSVILKQKRFDEKAYTLFENTGKFLKYIIDLGEALRFIYNEKVLLHKTKVHFSPLVHKIALL